MADIPEILKGPGMDIVSGLALGAFMGNPLLGLALAPQVNQMRRGGEASIAKTKAATDAQLFETAELRRLKELKQDIPTLMSAQQSTGVMAPGAKEAEAMRLGAEIPAIAPYLMRSKDSRPTVEENFEAVERLRQKYGLSDEDVGILRGTMAPPRQLTPMEIATQELQYANEKLKNETMVETINREATERTTTKQLEVDESVGLLTPIQQIWNDLGALEGTWLEPGSGLLPQKKMAASFFNSMNSFEAFQGLSTILTDLTPEEQERVRISLANLEKNSQLFTLLQAANSKLNGTATLLGMMDTIAPGSQVPPAVARSVIAQFAMEQLRADDRRTDPNIRLKPAERGNYQRFVNEYKTSQQYDAGRNSSIILKELVKSGVYKAGDHINYNGETVILDDADVAEIMAVQQ